eukprot:m.471306 g.471306  ORF g.471306 m.471306 type:complete len:570 (-) comp20375_c2_seq4:159-1868(-)
MYNMLSNPPDRLSVLQDVQSTVRQLQQHLITHGHHAEALLQGDTFRGVLVNKETTPREHINLALLAEQAMATAIVFYGIVPDVEGKGQLLLTRVVWPDQDTVELHQRPIDLGSLADVVKAGRPQRVETAHQEARQADDSANETANSELLVPLESLINGCRLRDKATRDGSAPGPALDQAGQTTSKSASRGTDGEAAAEAAEALATTRQALTNLRKVLIPPSVEDVIATCDPGDPHDAPSIVFVPHQALHLVPFAALLSPDGIPLIAQCEVSCVPSLHALQTCFERHQQQVAAGVEATADGDQPVAASAATRPTPNALVVGNPSPMPAGLEPLDGADGEADFVAQHIGAGTKVLVGTDALASNIVSSLLNDKPHIVHFATHGVQDPLTLLEDSGLVPAALAAELRAARSWGLKGGLACAVPADHRPEHEEGDPDFQHTAFLDAHRIADLDLSHVGLAVLSACNSHRGHFNYLPSSALGVPQDGSAGLSLAFLRAGLPRAVVTLWSVSDSETAYLMHAFYFHLLSDDITPPFPPRHVVRCLRLAIHNLWEAHPHTRKDPLYWAAFVVYGLA